MNNKINSRSKTKTMTLLESPIRNVQFRARENKTARLPQKTVSIPVAHYEPPQLEDIYNPQHLTRQMLESIWPEVRSTTSQPEHYRNILFSLSEKAPELMKDPELRQLGHLLIEEKEMQMLLHSYRNQCVMV